MFDYIVIGGGSAGSVLAARLSERLEGEIAGLDASKAEPRFVTALVVAA